MKKSVFIGADHAGYKLKESLKNSLKKYKVSDLGNKKLDPKDDYPIFASKVAKAVAKNKSSYGILICGSGQGMCMAANKIKGIRAALCEHEKDAYSSRRDDNCNILCLQGRGTSLEKAKKIVKLFLETEFNTKEKKYQRRINEVNKLEK